MGRKDYSKVAADFTAVIKELSSKPQNLENMESYLAVHFAAWLKYWAITPEALAEELQMYASMKFEED